MSARLCAPCGAPMDDRMVRHGPICRSCYNERRRDDRRNPRPKSARGSTRATRRARILDALEHANMTSNELAALLRARRRTIYPVLTDLIDSGEIVRCEKTGVYLLADRAEGVATSRDAIKSEIRDLLTKRPGLRVLEISSVVDVDRGVVQHMLTEMVRAGIATRQPVPVPGSTAYQYFIADENEDWEDDERTRIIREVYRLTGHPYAEAWKKFRAGEYPEAIRTRLSYYQRKLGLR